MWIYQRQVFTHPVKRRIFGKCNSTDPQAEHKDYTGSVCVLYFSAIWFVFSHTTTSVINILPIHTEKQIQPVFDNESKRLAEKWKHNDWLESVWDSWRSMKALYGVSNGKSDSFPRNGSFEQLASKNRFN